MFGNLCPHVREASIADFDCRSVENGMQNVAWGKVDINQFQELSSNICCNIHAIGWVEPGEPASSLLLWLDDMDDPRFVFQFVCKTTYV